MRIDPPPRRAPTEAVVPMINVVFLLLIFFLMTATIAPPEPIEVVLPSAGGDEAPLSPGALLIGADGTLAWGELRGTEALDAAVEVASSDGARPLLIRADHRLDAARLAQLLGELHRRGIENAALVTAGSR